MKREAARKAIVALAAIENAIGILDEIAEEVEEKDHESFKGRISELMRSHFSMIMPIVRDYPEFDPDGEGSELYASYRSLNAITVT